MKNRPIALIILDGWGHRHDADHNPTQSVKTPTFDHLYETSPHLLINASGTAVGLPEGQMGNSEVGHLHLGAGRKVPQDLTRINRAVQQGEFQKNKTLLNALATAKKNHKSVHIIGLMSPGGVHSLDEHIAAMIRLTHQQGITKNYCHAVLDGRDTPPQSALSSLQKIENLYHELGSGKIASLIGRYYAMDRDKRWDRTEQAYNLLTQGIATRIAPDAVAGLEAAYKHQENDEFVKATSLHRADESPTLVEDGDVIIFMNFRADRARQLCYALTEPDFEPFYREVFPQLATLVTLTEYASNLKADVAFPSTNLNNTLGECVAKAGLTQLRIAETEKYAHVTYFMNGGNEQPFDHEDRHLIPSPKVATYDLQPEMSAIELTDQLVAAIESEKYDLIICNYANPDMVGHTGIESAAQTAVATIDLCIKRVLDALNKVQGETLITADHGNIECMFDEDNQQPHTAHTTNLVPLIYVGRKAQFTQNHGALDDVAPTLLYLMGLSIPPEMTGNNLLSLDAS